MGLWLKTEKGHQGMETGYEKFEKDFDKFNKVMKLRLVKSC